MVRVSVCMAVYNGEKFIKQQIESILKQLTSWVINLTFAAQITLSWILTKYGSGILHEYNCTFLPR